MAETLLSISEVLLYGREMTDIQYNYQQPQVTLPHTADASEDCDDPPRPGRVIGANSQLENQLATESAPFAPRFARIYGFSFEGGYYDLDAPIIMLVHGPGVPAERMANDPRAARAPESPDKSGAAAQDHSFADEIQVWSYDKADFSIRMDTCSGPIEDILLDIELGGGMGISGGKVAGGKVAGGKVAGGKVAGGKVAGGKVAGGKVSGGKVAGD